MSQDSQPVPALVPSKEKQSPSQEGNVLMNQNQLTNQQKLTHAARTMAHIKSELHQAVHPTVLRDRLKDLIEIMEWLLFGQVSNAQPNIVPGIPANAYEDSSRTRVEFYGGPQPPQYQVAQARSPINNGDVQFMPGPPPGTSIGGQSVEYYRDGQNVDQNGNPTGQQPQFQPQPPLPPQSQQFMIESPPPPAPRIPGADYRGGQSVEFSGGPQRPAPIPPGAPVSNQPAQIISTPPTLNTEAGHQVAPIPGYPPHRQEPPNGFPSVPTPHPGTPQNLEEVRARIPIPLAD